MAEVLISPGVLARENDQSQITAGPIQAGAAIIGPTVKGQNEIPQLITSYSEYLASYGSTFLSGSNQYTYFTSISAYNYFQNGGNTLLVTKVSSASMSPATSSFMITGSDGAAVGQTGEATSPFVLETISDGAIMNSGLGNDSSPTGTNGTLGSGSSDNYRWEITTPNTASGTFGLLIRSGNDTNSSKQVIETYPNLSLDPLATNYIARVIGDQTDTLLGSGTGVYLQTTGSFPNASRFVRVKSVGYQTPNYLDNDGNARVEFTSSIPSAQSGSFGSANGGVGFVNAGDIAQKPQNYYATINNTNQQGLDGSDYTKAINLLANRDEYRYNLITAPGLILDNASTGAGWTLIQSNCENRGDAIFVGDLSNYNSSITQVGSTAASVDSSYVATYWPWLMISDPDSRQLVWVPASAMIPGVYAYNDRAGEPWFAPAGINRGGLGSVRQAERKLTNANRDTLYQAKVNPIATFPGTGIVVFGQKTLQTKASALDRVNVRRLLITLKNYISQIADTLVFEQNTAATRNTFLSQVNPYLESVQQRQGLYAFKVVMDNSNNTPDVIDRNELIGAVYLQPTKTAEFIYLDFNILPTGATFPA
tara:strand:+ start:4369 stop:6150 length:1782 start_codon:yes stop_codon:yes gene_type:complete